jgi:hypothetical protein
VPIKIINAENLPTRMTIVADASIQTNGDYNKIFATAATRDAFVNAVVTADKAGQNPLDTVKKRDYQTKKPFAIITPQYHWQVSKGYVDMTASIPNENSWSTWKSPIENATYTPINTSTVWTGSSYNTTYSKLSANAKYLISTYGEERTKYLEVNNAALGFLNAGHRAWTRTWEGQTNPFYTGSGSYYTGNMLEWWSLSSTKKCYSTGATVGYTRMANFDNSNAGPHYCPWYIYYHYDRPNYISVFDEDYLDPTYVPPGAINIGKVLSWKVVTQ